LVYIKRKCDTRAFRKAWKPGKYIILNPGSNKILSFIELKYDEENRLGAPWTPTRCDLIENDWEILL